MHTILTKENYKNFIDAKAIKIGKNVKIGNDTKIIGVKGPAEYVEFGDNVFIDNNIFIMAPIFIIGDYGTIFKNCRISGYSKCEIGHNFWCDQNTILNCTDELTIGDNVGIGAYSQFWTHIKFGDILEGCRFNSTKKMTIGNDVWFVGHCIVSPIVAKNKSMAMVGSVITKDMDENKIYGGSPAIDLSPKIGNQFIDRTVSEKVKMMKQLLNDFDNDQKNLLEVIESWTEATNSNVTYFNVSERKYTKRGSDLETKFMQYLLPLHKFTPYQKTL